MQLSAIVTPCYRNILTGKETPLFDQKNLHMFGCADIMARLLNGEMNYRISHMYFQYQNTNSSPSVNPTQVRSKTRASFDSISGGAPNYEDWLRVPIITLGKIQKVPDTTEDYDGNAVIFNATSAASETMAGESPAHNYYASSGANGPSKIVAAYLVAAPKGSESKGDIVFSGVTLTSPVTMQPGHHISIYWMQKFN